jgi:hypothetical protein
MDSPHSCARAGPGIIAGMTYTGRLLFIGIVVAVAVSNATARVDADLPVNTQTDSNNVGWSDAPSSIDASPSAGPKTDSSNGGWIAALANNKDAATALWQVVATIGLALGGGWTLWRAFRMRQHYPSADVSLSVLANNQTPKGRLIRIRFHIANVGKVILRVGAVEIWVQQVAPYELENLDELLQMPTPLRNKEFTPVAEAQWPLFEEQRVEYGRGQQIIEPNETDEIDVELLMRDTPGLFVLYGHVGKYPRWYTRRMKVRDGRIAFEAPPLFGWGRSLYLTIEEEAHNGDEDCEQVKHNEEETAHETGESEA